MHDEIDEIAARYSWPQWKERGPALLPVCLFYMFEDQTAALTALAEGQEHEAVAQKLMTELARWLHTSEQVALELHTELIYAMKGVGLDHIETIASLCLAATVPPQQRWWPIAHAGGALVASVERSAALKQAWRTQGQRKRLAAKPNFVKAAVLADYIELLDSGKTKKHARSVVRRKALASEYGVMERTGESPTEKTVNEWLHGK